MSAADRYDELQARTFSSATTATTSSLDRRMRGESIERFLTAKRYAAVATTRRDGRPHLAMTGFLADGDAVWLPTMADTVRARNVSRSGYASIVVTEGEGDEHTMVTLEGPAEVLPALDPATADRWTTIVGDLPDWATAWIEVRVERVLSYAATDSPYA